MTEEREPLDLDPVLERYAYYLDHRSPKPCPAHPSADDVADLVAEVRYLRYQLEIAERHIDRGNTETGKAYAQLRAESASNRVELTRVRLAEAARIERLTAIAQLAGSLGESLPGDNWILAHHIQEIEE